MQQSYWVNPLLFVKPVFSLQLIHKEEWLVYIGKCMYLGLDNLQFEFLIAVAYFKLSASPPNAFCIRLIKIFFILHFNMTLTFSPLSVQETAPCENL